MFPKAKDLTRPILVALLLFHGCGEVAHPTDTGPPGQDGPLVDLGSGEDLKIDKDKAIPDPDKATPALDKAIPATDLATPDTGIVDAGGADIVPKPDTGPSKPVLLQGGLSTAGGAGGKVTLLEGGFELGTTLCNTTKNICLTGGLRP